jgi:hypothetical protein
MSPSSVFGVVSARRRFVGELDALIFVPKVRRCGSREGLEESLDMLWYS